MDAPNDRAMTQAKKSKDIKIKGFDTYELIILTVKHYCLTFNIRGFDYSTQKN